MADAFHTIEIDHEIAIDAPVEQVYALVSDVTRIGEWSPECLESKWVSGEPGAVGSRFVGSNYEHNTETGRVYEWEMTSEVVEAQAPHVFAWSVLTEAWDLNTSVWRFIIEDDGSGGAILRQSYRMARPPKGWQPILDRHDRNKQAELVAARRARLDAGMQATLVALAATFEKTISTRRAYDSVALDFAERTARRSEMAADFFDQFSRELPAAAMVADLGCGPGHDAARMAAAGHRSIGIDISAGLLALCPESCHAVQADLRSLPLDAASVDGVWSSAALLHIDSSEIGAAFSEWDRVLRPGGLVGMATSLASDAEPNRGWELVPAGPDRRPEIADGHQRWFAHHESAVLLGAVEDVGWTVVWSTMRSSHRTWLQVLAQKSG